MQPRECGSSDDRSLLRSGPGSFLHLTLGLSSVTFSEEDSRRAVRRPSDRST